MLRIKCVDRPALKPREIPLSVIGDLPYQAMEFCLDVDLSKRYIQAVPKLLDTRPRAITPVYVSSLMRTTKRPVTASSGARLKKKFESDEVRAEKLKQIAMGASALEILAALRELDDGRR